MLKEGEAKSVTGAAGSLTLVSSCIALPVWNKTTTRHSDKAIEAATGTRNFARARELLLQRA